VNFDTFGLASAVMRQTGSGRYLFLHVALTLRRRARQLNLVLRHGRRDARHKAINLHRRVVRDVLQRNRERYVL
jgi:hypothetical protein